MMKSRITLIGMAVAAVFLICFSFIWYSIISNEMILNSFPKEIEYVNGTEENETDNSVFRHNGVQLKEFMNIINVSKPKTTSEVTNVKLSSPITFRKFVICFSYWEQQTNAVLNLWSFQKWANQSGHFSVVEPFVSNSVLGFSDNQLNKHDFTTSLRFRDYFDIERWTNGTAKYSIPPLVSWDNFIQHASKEIIVVLTAFDANPGGYYIGGNINKNYRCSSESRQHIGNINSLLSFLGLKVVKTLCYAYYKKTNNKRLSEFNFNLELKRNATILFSFWRGIEPGRITMDEPLLWRQRETDVLSMLFPSPRIMYSSKNYLKSVLNVSFQEYTAIVFRSVRRQQEMRASGYSLTKVLESYYKCFSQLPDMLKSLGLKPFLATDLGRFGDQTQQFARNKDLFQRALNAVYSSSKMISEYEEEFIKAADGVTDTGYIGGMQKAIALNAKCIIMMGGFSTYQSSIVNHYKSNNQTCIKYLCYERPFD
ncbi:uncharacterized protein [Dysidea avara]|uniref:uncharacterized protein isoform X1 n=2 Tax=Dysidea avara TaxID=196820 RepID=UPI003319460B